MKKFILALMMFAVTAFAQANGPEVYAVAKGKNVTLTLYAVKDRCPGNTRLAVWIQYGVSTPGCWLWGAEDIMIKYWDDWNRAKLYRVKDFEKDPYYVQQEAADLERRRKIALERRNRQ